MFGIYNRHQININFLNEERFKQKRWQTFKKWITASTTIAIATAFAFVFGLIAGSFLAIAPVPVSGVLALTLSSARYFR